jgi:hypothetical protein
VKRALLLLSVLLIGTCALAAQKVQTRQLPANPWVAITPLPNYRIWWAKNEACLSLIPAMKLTERVEVPAYFVEFDAVHWYVAGTTSFINHDGREVLGQFFPPDTVVLAGLLLQDERLVRHELLHVMGWSYHPSVPFRFPCDVV